MKIRRLTCLVLVLISLSSGLPAASALAFSDIAGHPLCTEIEAAAKRGLVFGYEDGTFHPDEQVTRAQFAAMLNRALALDGAQAANSDFTDVFETDWHYADVQNAFAQGYMQGYPDGTFRPDAAITRYEAATILERIAAFAENSGIALNHVPDWAADGVRYVLAEKLFTAFVKDAFQSDRAMTRAEAASVLWRFLDSFRAPPAFFLPASGSDRWLYKNEYTYFSFALSGHGVALSVPARTDNNAEAFYKAVKELAEPVLSDMIHFGVVPLGSEGLPYFEAERVNDNLLIYTVCAGASDEVPAGFTVELSIPDGSPLMAFSLKSNKLSVEITRLGEAASAASNVLTMRRMVSGEVRRFASWDAARHAARYEATLFLRRADGSIVEGSERKCKSAIRIENSRAEVDYSYELTLLTEKLYPEEEGRYICMRIDAYPAKGEPYLFYPVELAFTASDSVELYANGNLPEVANRMVRKDGLTLDLKLVDRTELLRELPSGIPEAGGYRCLFELALYDADGNRADKLFTLEQDGKQRAVGSKWELTQAVQKAGSGDLLASAILRANADTPAGDYSIVAVLRLTGTDGTKEYGRVILTSVFTLS